MSERKGFYPHMNRSLGKYYGSEKEYTADLKKGGFVPYKDVAHIDGGKRKEYKPSEQTQELVREIAKQSNGNKFNPSNSLKTELHKRGILKTQDDIQRMKKDVEEKTGRKFK